MQLASVCVGLERRGLRRGWIASQRRRVAVDCGVSHGSRTAAVVVGGGVWMGSLGRNWVCPAVPDLMLGFLNGAFHYAVGVGFYDVPNDIRDGL